MQKVRKLETPRHYLYSYLVEQVEVLLSQFEWKSRDSPTETWLTDRYRSTDSLSFVTPANFPRAVTVRRMANDVTYTMYAALPIHYVYNAHTHTYERGQGSTDLRPFLEGSHSNLILVTPSCHHQHRPCKKPKNNSQNFTRIVILTGTNFLFTKPVHHYIMYIYVHK